MVNFLCNLAFSTAYSNRKDKEKRTEDELKQVEQKNWELKEKYQKYENLVTKLKQSCSKEGISLPEFINAK